MFFIELKYLRIISNRLPRFKQHRGDVWNCRCIICGDSKKNERKARGYFYRSDQSIAYKCWNCDASMWFSSFLEKLDPEIYKEYRFEMFKENGGVVTEHKKEPEYKQDAPKFKKRSSLDILMDRLDELPDDNIAVKFCLDRKIPRSQLKKLYYIDDIRKIHQLNEKYKESILSDECRLFIPFYNFNGEFSGGTMRALHGQARRYITVNIKDNSQQVFGINEADPSKPLYVVEGPFDSLFLDNAIAVGGTGFGKISDISDRFEDIVYIIDNQPHNKEVCLILQRLINKGHSVVIWPSNVNEKDINEMVQNGKNVVDIINNNCYNGISAQMRFNLWKKC